MKISKLLILALSGILALAVIGCASPQTTASTTEIVDPKTPLSSDISEKQQYPIVINHAFGTTTIEKKPERIVTVGWANQDTPLALGIVPVGFSMMNYGVVDEYGMHAWTAAKVKDLGETSPNVFKDTDGLDYEAISDAQPDIILAAYSGLTQDEYDLLSEIAPVVAYPREPWQTYWREQIEINSKAVGMEAEGKQYITELEELISTTAKQYPQLEGKDGAFFWIDATDLSTFYLYFPVDPRADYLTDLGVTFPDELNALRASESEFSATLSAENIDALYDLDIIVAYGDASLLPTLQADPLFGTVPAIQRGSVVFVDPNTDLAGASTPSALSIPYTIEEYVGLLAKAADKV
jgi:iron complex transport system substrate-binding protein